MLMSQRQMLNSQNLRFPNPERIPKVNLFLSLFMLHELITGPVETFFNVSSSKIIIFEP